MRILMLGWELPPHNSGGLGVACYYMARALAWSEGFDLRVHINNVREQLGPSGWGALSELHPSLDVPVRRHDGLGAAARPPLLI